MREERRWQKWVGIAAVAVAAAGASAQSFDGRVAFGITHDTNNTPAIENGGVYEVDVNDMVGPVTLNFSLLFWRLRRSGLHEPRHVQLDGCLGA